jgi:hypothetical protein
MMLHPDACLYALQNILMDDNANVRVADFGLAAVAAPFGKGLTQQCGTPGEPLLSALVHRFGSSLLS